MRFSNKALKPGAVAWATLAPALLLIALFAAPLALAGGPAEDGASTYKAKCAMCHGPDGSGNTPMGKKMKLRDLRSAEVQKQTDEQLIEIMAKGKNKMPGYEKSLSKSQIKDLVAYIRELAHKK